MVSKNGETPKCSNTNGASVSNKSQQGNIDMNIVQNKELTFHNVTLTPAPVKDGVWLTSADIAKALGYASSKSVSTIYSRNSEEFTGSMSMVIKMETNGINNNLRDKSVRVFSLRGAHLIAMFARTPVAKEFRRWVLDILDREVAQGNVNPVSKRIYSMSLSSDEMCSLAWLYKAAVHLQEDAQMISKAMEFLDSTVITGLSSIAHYYKFILEDAGTVLAREIGKNVDESMDSTNWKKALSTLQIH